MTVLCLCIAFVIVAGWFIVIVGREMIREQEAREEKRLTAPLPPPRESLLPVEWSHGRALRRVALQRPRNLVGAGR